MCMFPDSQITKRCHMFDNYFRSELSMQKMESAVQQISLTQTIINNYKHQTTCQCIVSIGKLLDKQE